MTNKGFLLILMLSCSFFCQADIQWQDHPHVKVALISQKLSDGSLQSGVLFQPEDGWHIYWQNAGDTGLPPQVLWQDDTLQYSSLHWPFPEAIPFGHLINYGYHGQTLIFSEAKPANANTADTIEAHAKWLICKEACIPGKADLSTQHVQHKPDSDISRAFTEAQALLPQSIELMGSQLEWQDKQLSAALYAKSLLFQQAQSVEVFPLQQDIIQYSSPAKVYWKKNLLRWQQPLSEYFSEMPNPLELVVVVDKKRAYAIRLNTES